MVQSTHENFVRNETPIAGSDQSFGIVMATAFGVLSLLNAWRGGRMWPWTAGAAALFLAAAVLFPTALYPLNRVWLKFGQILHKVVNPIVMAVLFFGAVFPTGLVVRVMGKDLLRLRRQPEAISYWIERRPPGPLPETMKDQF
jgi:Saxitoxin biosynthesis operon protein SxtJ